MILFDAEDALAHSLEEAGHKINRSINDRWYIKW